MAERGLSASRRRKDAKPRASIISLSLPIPQFETSPSLLTFLVQRLVLGASSGGGRRSVRLLGNLGGLDIVRSDFDRGAFEAAAREEEGSLGCRFLGSPYCLVSALLFLLRTESREKRDAADGWNGDLGAHLCERDVGLSVDRSLNASNLAAEPAISNLAVVSSRRSECGDAAVGASGVRPSGRERGTDEKKCSSVSLVVVLARPLTRTTCALVVADELVEARGEVVVCRRSDDDVARETKGNGVHSQQEIHSGMSEPDGTVSTSRAHHCVRECCE